MAEGEDEVEQICFKNEIHYKWDAFWQKVSDCQMDVLEPFWEHLWLVVYSVYVSEWFLLNLITRHRLLCYLCYLMGSP